jgi:hypothetical protein
MLMLLVQFILLMFLFTPYGHLALFLYSVGGIYYWFYWFDSHFKGFE